MALTTTRCDFTVPEYWSYDEDLIEIVDNVASLKLQDNTGQTFTEDFADDTGFTYDSTNAEFGSGSVSQLDRAPSDSVIAATYTSSTDLSWSTIGSSLTGSDYGSPVIVGNTLECIGANGKRYTITNNIGVGSVKFKYTPNYSSGPPTNINMFNLVNSANNNSRVTLTNSPSGNNFRIFVRDESGTTIFSTVIFGSSSSLVEGTEYEILFTWDSVNGICRMFIDGTLLVTSSAIPWTHGSGEAYVDLGASALVYKTADANFSDMVLFDSVQETADYTAGYTLQETRYIGSKVDLPTFSYGGVGAIQEFTNFVTTESNDPKYTINDMYYNNGWVSSTGEWLTSSTKADILANISTLPASDDLEISVIFNSGAVEMSISNLIATYTGQIYPTSAPTIKHAPAARCYMTEMAAPFTVSAVTPSGDELRYSFLLNGTETYWSGSVWEASNGSFAQTNDETTVNTNVGDLLDGTRVQTGIEIHLSSGDGTTTPRITYLEINNDAALPDVDMTPLDINGYTYDCNLPLAGVEVYVRPYRSGFNNPNNGVAGVFNVYDYKLIATSVDDGFWSGGVLDNPVGKSWEFLFVLPSGKKQSYYTNLNDAGSIVDFSKLDVKVVAE